MELADILSEQSVLVCTDLKTKHDVLERLALQASQVTGEDAAAISEALETREALGSTGLGNGIAVPHGRFSGLRKVTAVFAHLRPAVEFDAVDDLPVDLVMMLLAPLGAGADHLKALAHVARTLRTDMVADRLRASFDPQTLYRILTDPLDAHQAA